MGMIMIVLNLIGGILLSAQSSINGTLSRKAGAIETTLLTLITGSMFLAVVIIFFGSGKLLNIFDAPKWQLSAAFLGALYMLLVIAAVPKIGVIATNIAAIAGQLIISLIIDHFGWFNSMVIPLDLNRAIALVFILVALYFIYKGNKRSNEEN
ncbi:membrane protein [Bacillus sp. SA1-12]|uniref:DMT family transporter n=1 Tax=Bacillus sp. SA1-12 TaxID=1455638 RepID=UPI000625FC9E|nr:DMT family transporter [Bacillus sp. SA1-12]KKI92743.1 membrane protein [Bacillus sp. SA1-12]